MRDEAKQRAIARRVAKHGLVVFCAGCELEQRHRPGNGRLREARCRACQRNCLKTAGWIARHETRWRELVKRYAAVRRPFLES